MNRFVDLGDIEGHPCPDSETGRVLLLITLAGDRPPRYGKALRLGGLSY